MFLSFSVLLLDDASKRPLITRQGASLLVHVIHSEQVCSSCFEVSQCEVSAYKRLQFHTVPRMNEEYFYHVSVKAVTLLNESEL